jgi:5-methylcytosine-specific restriction protein A
MGRLRALPPRLGAAPSRWPRQPKQRADHYGTPEHAAWSKAVKERAGWRCEECHATGCKLYADHVLEIADAPHLALELSNGRALCSSCHGRKTEQARQARLASPAI